MNDIEQQVAALISIGVRNAQENTPRTLQSRAGKLGPSDIGWCRQKATLMIRGVRATDSKPSWAAAVGTAIHEYVGTALAGQFPDWHVDSPATPNPRVTAVLDRIGVEVSGTPDIIAPDLNAVLDIKTVDGFTMVQRNGPSLNHRMQRHLYAMGAINLGLLDRERPVYVGNVYLDRSGKQADPYVTVEEFDPSLTDEINAWAEDVIYAAQHGEDASRDVAAAVCEKVCEFFTACRGALPARDGEPITDPSLVDAIHAYDEGRKLERRGAQMKRDAAAVLTGINGSDGQFQVRWVTIAGSEVPGYYRAESTRIDVRKVRGAAK